MTCADMLAEQRNANIWLKLVLVTLPLGVFLWLPITNVLLTYDYSAELNINRVRLDEKYSPPLILLSILPHYIIGILGYLALRRGSCQRLVSTCAVASCVSLGAFLAGLAVIFIAGMNVWGRAMGT